MQHSGDRIGKIFRIGTENDHEIRKVRNCAWAQESKAAMVGYAIRERTRLHVFLYTFSGLKP